MKKYLCILIVLIWVNTGYCQLERQWSAALDTAPFFTDVISAHLINDQIVFNQINYDEGYEVLSKELKIHESVNGSEVWRFNWSDYPLHSDIKILPLNDDQVYFVVNNSHANGTDYYGVLDLFGNVVWQDSLYISSLVNVSKLGDKLLIDASKHDGINKLVLVDENGTESWILQDGTYDSWNNLISNDNDKAIWLNNNGLTLIDASSEILARDSVSEYSRYFSHFEVLENEVIALSWDPFDFIVKKYSNDFQTYTIDTLNYAFNIFGTPHPTIISQANGNTFIESDFTYEGDSFIAKYNPNFEKEWVNDSADDIVNIFPTTEEVIVIDVNSINVLNNVTGILLYEKPFETNEQILRKTAKNEIYDPQNKILYAFTYLDGTSYLNQFKESTTSALNLQEESSLNLFPVPATNKLYVENIADFKTANIYDMNGKFLFSSDLDQGFIITESLPQGTYILELISQSKSMTSKFIKM